MNRFRFFFIAALTACATAAAAQGPRPAALDKVLPGSWTLHEIGTRGASRAICVRDTGMLLQIHHGNASCGRSVITESPRTATIAYTCTGQGHGRTTITVENPSLARIQTQGLARGAPFDADYEARRGGGCPS